jgi:hypothetical protein
VAKSVVAYDLARDGSLLVTDGMTVQRVEAEGGSPRRVAKARLVTGIVAL